MNNGKRSYFSANKNASNVPENDVQKGEVELEIKELNLEGDLSGDVSGKTEVSGSDSETIDDNSNDTSSDMSDAQDVSDSSDFSEGDDTSSSEESGDDSSDDMEDISDDNEDNNLEEKKEDSENEKDDKEKKDDEDKKDDDRENKEPDEKQKLDEKDENKDLNNEPTDGKEQPESEDKGSSNEESNNSNGNDNKSEGNDDTTSKSSQNEDSSNSQNSDKSSKKDDQSKPQDESNNKSKEPSSSKKKDDNQGGLPKNNQKGRSPQDIKNNLKNNLKDGLNPKNMAQNAFNRSKLGQGINKAKNTVNNAKKAINTTKKAAKGAAKVGKAAAKGAAKAAQVLVRIFMATFPWNLAVIAMVAVIVIAMVAVVPGSSDNVNEGTSGYSKVDQKTLEKMQKLFNKYPNADGTLAMAVVLYPYYEILYDGEVNDYLRLATDEEPVDIEDDTELDEENDGDTEDIEDEEKKSNENDMYLEPFRKSKIRNKLKNVLKKLNNSTEEEFNQYLKEEYFKKDKGYSAYDGSAFNGYKEMFDSIPSSERDALADAIIENLYEIKDVFINYVFTPEVCSSSSTSLGYSDGTDLIKGQAVVVFKDTNATSISSIKSAPTLFGTDDYHLDLKRYVMGVAYAEVGDWLNNEEYAKTTMIAAKSFVLARTHPGGAGAGMNRTPDYEGDRTIFYMKNNVGDQVFCDVYEGCQSGSRYALDTITPGNGPGINPKPALSSDKLTLLEQWYDETAGKFIYNANTEEYYSSYVADNYYTYCQKGSCLLQTAAHQDALNGSGYEAILKKYYSNDEFVIKDIETNTLSAVSVACSSVLNGGCTIPEDEFVYYSQRSYNDNFCGRTDGTISSSGCGVTSMAMVIANLTDNKLTPVDTMNEAHQGGHCGAGIYGTSASYFSVAASKYGLTYESIPSSDTSLDADKKIKDTLNSGGLIIANVAGSETAGSGNAWSTVSNGHYLVIKGITADEKLIIADPMTTALNNPWKNNLTIEEMRSYMNERSFYLFTGGKSDEIKDKYCSSKGAGYLGNPLNPNDFTSSFMNSGNARCFPNYCNSGSPHGAVDIALDEGTPIYAMDSGTVEVSRRHISWGNYVLINHGNGYKTLYAHFSELGVSEGQQVTKGQLIGKSGNTGNSTGPHLHIELQNIALYNANGRTAAKSSDSKGLMNPAKYINSNVSYIGQSN